MTGSRRTFLKTAGATVLGVTVAGCAGSSSDGSTETTSETTTSEPESTATESLTTTSQSRDISASVGSQSDANLELTEHTFFHDGSTEGVRGTVTNTNEETYSLVLVHVNPKSENGDTLGRFEVDSSESIDTLEPGATWDFEVTFDGDLEFTQYTIWVTGQTEEGSSGSTNTSNTSG